MQAAALEDALDRLRRGVHGVLADVREARERHRRVELHLPERARGALDRLHGHQLRRRIGTPSAPADPAPVSSARTSSTIRGGLDALLPAGDRAERAFGANTGDLWSPSNALYRGNVLLYMRTLAARGARPALMISTSPYTGGEAVEWWREAARYGDLIREVYFKAPNVRRSARSAATGTCATTSPSGGRADRDRDLAT